MLKSQEVKEEHNNSPADGLQEVVDQEDPNTTLNTSKGTMSDGTGGATEYPIYDLGVNVASANEEEQDIDASNLTIPQLVSRTMARHAWKTIIFTLIIATLISAIGLIVGEFSISVDNDGWRSRRTTISKRGIQSTLLDRYQHALFWSHAENGGDNGYLWEQLRTERSTNFNWQWISDPDADDTNTRRSRHRHLENDQNCSSSWHGSRKMVKEDNLAFTWKTSPQLNDDDKTAYSALDTQVLHEICQAESNTLALLESNNLCIRCQDDGKCLEPHSLVHTLKLYLEIQSNSTISREMSCKEMMDAYTPSIRSSFTDALVTCVEDIKAAVNPITGKVETNVTSCTLPSFDAHLVSKDFGIDDTLLRFTTSIFYTDGYSQEIYAINKELDTGSDDNIVKGSYNTIYSSFTEVEVDSALSIDMFIGSGSLAVTAIAMVIHTKSIWLAFMGILQIVYSIPLAYFVYHFIAGLKFFPVLNFVGIFVVAALGADDVFVAVDKWKNTRIKYPHATTEEIAMKALPNAASAMLLTTLTTAIAFFATTLCPVAPIRCFAVYCGLLIIFDYFMDVILMFPTLCIYDRWLLKGKNNCFVTLFYSAKYSKSDPHTDNEPTILANNQLPTPKENFNDNQIVKEDIDGGEDETNNEPKKTDKASLIHRILLNYYNIAHDFRWIFIIICAGAIGICVYTASTFKLPEDSAVQLLPDDNKVRRFNKWWPDEILSNFLELSGSSVVVVWGLDPSDDGNVNDPMSIPRLTTGNFDPSSTKAQEYLLDFCDRLYSNPFTAKPSENYICPMNNFNTWLQEQSESSIPDDAYVLNCNGASSIPIPADTFNDCILGWAYLPEVSATLNYQILPEDGRVKVMRVAAVTDISWSNTYNEIDARWKEFERFMDGENELAPEGVQNEMFHDSGLFWWYDTNGVMWKVAVYSAVIAIGFSAIIVLLSSKSIILALISSTSILYVLGATIASLVGMGWSLGFVESICIAILVGISCDFIIHFCHAYCIIDGSRHDRTKYALIHMGPSVLAAALTTFMAAIIMFFCNIVFFTKFAQILFMTILHSTLGAFVVFLTLVDTIGPNDAGICYNKLRLMLPCCQQREEIKERSIKEDEKQFM